MAEVTKKVWYARGAGGRRAKRAAWGYTVQVNGRQVRKFNSEWSEQDAEKALAAVRLGIAPSSPTPEKGISFGEAVERYLKAKARKKSLAHDELYLGQLKTAFGKDTPLVDISGACISAWKADRLAAINPRTSTAYAVATINRPLAALRHLLRLAHEEWGALPSVPRIRLEREPQGRIRWLEPDEEARLMAACQASRNAQLPGIVTVALETGLRRGELLGLTWDRVDLSRGVIRLEITKSGKRREVPMRQAVYDVLVALPGPREGRVWRQRKIRTAFENAVEAAKLDDFRFHDCRHHFASWFVMRRGSLQALKEILGHADLKMTLRYAHLAPDHLRSEMMKTESSAQGSAQSVATEVAALEPAS